MALPELMKPISEAEWKVLCRECMYYIYHVVIPWIRERLSYYLPIIDRVGIILAEFIPTAATDGKYIYINPYFFVKMCRTTDRLFVFLHELQHIVLLHPERGEDKIPEVWNIATDAVVNRVLIETCAAYPTLEFLQKSVTLDKIAEVLRVPKEQLLPLTEEELYDLILTKKGVVIIEGYGPGGAFRDIMKPEGVKGMEKEFEKKYGRKPRSAEIRAPAPHKDDREFYEDLKRGIRECLERMKTAGARLPAPVLKFLMELLEGKIDWKELFRDILSSLAHGVYISTWTKLSRRLPYVLPGYKVYGIEKVWILIDESGSISDDELKYFLTEVYHLLEETKAKGIVIRFFSYMEEPIEFTTPEDVFKKVERRTGGTIIGDALRYVNENMSYYDPVVILTDGEIFDIEDPEVVRTFEEVVSKASLVVFVTTHTIPPLPEGVVVIRTT